MNNIKNHFEQEAHKFDETYDVVISSLALHYLITDEDKKTFMRKNVSSQEIENKWLPKYKEEDRPAQLVDQLHWLINIGSINVDVVWKYYNFAVYGGTKK